jgi:ERCC4-type nuclease
VLVSPAEPKELKAGKTVSTAPEQFGADFLTLSPVFGRVGIQRKTVTDLIASLGDRVPREITLLKRLDLGIWLIEGTPQWTVDGHLLSSTSSSFTNAQYLGILWSLQSNGFWLAHTSSMTDTIKYLSLLDRWLRKDHHSSLLRRQEPRSVLGKVDKRDRQVWIMQGFPGVGYEKAKAIVDEVDGLPFIMNPAIDLSSIRGIGPIIAKRIEQCFSSD